MKNVLIKWCKCGHAENSHKEKVVRVRQTPVFHAKTGKIVGYESKNVCYRAGDAKVCEWCDCPQFEQDGPPTTWEFRKDMICANSDEYGEIDGSGI